MVPDADHEETFLKKAAKIWRKCHPVKRGRPSVERLIFEECCDLYKSKKISEKTSIEKISNAVTDSLEDRKRENRQKIPYESTVLKRVREWRQRVREMISKRYTLEDMHKALLDVKPGRPYNPWSAMLFPRKK